MSTYNDASLIYYPSGYKAGTAYSLKPTDGSGDLTFTRASSATRVNEQGLIEGVRTNLVLYSQNFENAYWTKTGSTVTSGFSSPLAAYPTSGYKLGASNTISTPKYINSSIITVGGGTATIVTSQFFIKKSEKTKVGISDGHYNQGWVAVDLTDGSVISNGGVGYISNSVQLFVDDWYLISLTFTTHSSGTYKTTVSLLDDSYVSGNTKNYAYVGVVGQGAYIFGSQSELGPSATEYIPTTTTAVSVGMLANVPRIDYTGGGCGKLLLEPQRTNLATQSEGNLATYPSNGGNVSNAATSILGFANSIQFGNNSVLTNCYKSIATTIGQTYSLSLFLQMDDNTAPIVGVNTTSGDFAVYMNGVFQAGAIATRIGNTNVYRITATYTTSGGSGSFGLIKFTGQSAKGFRFSGFQLELGSYPTSYIPTTSTAVTRVKDTSGTSGLSSLINSSEGTLYVEIRALANDQTERYITLNDGSNTNVVRIGYFVSNPNQILYQVNASGLQTNVLTTDYTITDFNKIAVTWKLNEFKLFINGSQVGATDTSGTSPIGLTTLAFGNVVGLNQTFYGENKGVMIFPSALSDTELATLTTI
jgi:hypothetical protein